MFSDYKNYIVLSSVLYTWIPDISGCGYFWILGLTGCMMVLPGSARGNQTGVQSQKAVTAYFSRKQLLPFGFARNPGVLPPSSGSGVPPSARVNNSRAGHSPPPPPRARIPQCVWPFPITAIYDYTRIITPLHLTRWQNKNWKQFFFTTILRSSRSLEYIS